MRIVLLKMLHSVKKSLWAKMKIFYVGRFKNKSFKFYKIWKKTLRQWNTISAERRKMQWLFVDELLPLFFFSIISFFYKKLGKLKQTLRLKCTKPNKTPYFGCCKKGDENCDVKNMFWLSANFFLNLKYLKNTKNLSLIQI